MALKGTFVWPFFIPMAILLALLAFFSFKTLVAVFTYERAMGTVTDWAAVQELSIRPLDESTNRDIVTFTAKDGKTYAVTTRSGSNASLPRGQAVRVYYPADRPAEGLVGIFRELWLVPLIFLVLWSVFFIIWFGALAGPVAVGAPDGFAKKNPPQAGTGRRQA